MKKSLQTLQEFFVLLWIRICVSFYNFKEHARVIIYYYPRFSFFKVDLSLLFSYWGKNPFHISKEFLLSKNKENIYAYGETPLNTFELIAKQCQIKAEDVVLELGCGRGRGCFWLHEFIGCKVVGIDFVPIFIKKANQIASRFGIKGVQFYTEDFFRTKLGGFTVIYLYGSCLSAKEIQKMINRFRFLQKGTKIITVSYALTDVKWQTSLKLIKKFTASFAWGNAIIYLHEVSDVN
jgi:SAM-dependent methyltransferase